MTLGNHQRTGSWRPLMLGMPLVALLILPIVALCFAASPSDILAGAKHPHFTSALWLSLRTSLISMAILVGFGTPLAWWLATAPRRRTRWLEMFVDLPIILPPAVVGVALLLAFGHQGLLGRPLHVMGLSVSFTSTAVVLAQIVVAAPFYLQSAASAFRRIDSDQILVARTLGQSPMGAFMRVTLPMALPGISVGAALAWARALGEFGATLLFAGNLPGTTQTVPLAIYAALETDVRIAIALSLVLAAFAIFLLAIVRTSPRLMNLGLERHES